MALLHIIETDLSAELKKSIFENFSKHSYQQMGSDGLAADPIVFQIMDKEQNYMAVCVCQIFWGNLHLKYLLTKEEFRNLGLARKLVEHACHYGRSKECSFVFVETMSFQAPTFYQKLGFKIEFSRSGFTGDSSFHYLKKDLLI